MLPSRLAMALMAALGLVGVSSCNRPAPDTRAADEQAIRTAEVEAAKAWSAGDIDAYMESYPEGSSWLPPNAPTVSGPQAIRELATQFAATPGFAFEVKPTKVEVSRAGDLGFLVGTYQLGFNDPQGNPVTERGKYVEVWRKHPDNTWKHELAIWNADHPPR